MKKVLSGCVAGVIGLSALLGAAACAKDPQETADREAPAYDNPAATLTVDATTDASKRDMRISEDLFGLFLEDINYASQALDDNLVSNSNFVTPKAGTSWRITDMWKTANATLSVETTEANRLNSTNESYARVSAQANGTLTNTGFEAVPMAVMSGVGYKLSMFVKNDGAAFDLTASIKDGSESYGEVTINVKQNASWVKYERTITATGTAAKDVVLELKFGAAAQILLDCVTLETTDSTVGIKNYIYTALEDLSPAFFRFPGGCIIEGAGMEATYDWKNSIGAVAVDGDDKVEKFEYLLDKDGTTSTVATRGEYATRLTNTNLWNVNNNDHKSHYYTMDYSIGFYEYFLLCDALDAVAIPIVNVGLDCQIQSTSAQLAGRHGNKIRDYIQDALDLVAFALGDPNSSDEDEAYWAQVRVDMGHPAAFNMKYLGIGNEQWSATYYSYYEQFLEAFKAAAEENPLYGKVQLIVGNGPNFDQCEAFDSDGNHITSRVNRGLGEAKAAAERYMNGGAITGYDEYGIVDHHYYMSSQDFLLNTHFYDNYDRGADRYEVFVGEYSANNNAQYNGTYQHTNNSWLTALAEAAYMTGLERNGDIVRLAAYAPMFGIASGADYSTPNNHWFADMMFFTNTELLLTPNYHVQQIFMKNAGTLKVKSAQLTFKAGEMPTTTFKGNGVAEATVDNIYQIVSKDEATGDIIVKIVNVGEDSMTFNVTVGSAKLTGIAAVTEISNPELTEVSTLANGNLIVPKTEKISFTDGTFGYAIKPYSVTAFRIRTK